jgi:hypothetical protein
VSVERVCRLYSRAAFAYGSSAPPLGDAADD